MKFNKKRKKDEKVRRKGQKQSAIDFKLKD